jgi:hypothetical protein
MTYYQANTDCEELICDNCGDLRWEEHPKYGSNCDARLAEAEKTGIRWSWVPRYSSGLHTCSVCNNPTK